MAMLFALTALLIRYLLKQHHCRMYGFFQSTFYFSYTALLCIALGLMTGTIGFFGASLFVRKIYQNVKID